MANLITGYRGTEHVTAADAGSFNAATIGSGKYIFERGQNFKAEIISNNLVRIYDGDMLNQGRHIRIDTGDYEDAEIATGLVDTYRNDIIVMRYSKDAESQVESAHIAVIQGVSGDKGVDPECVSGDILDGADMDDVPLYRVKIEGLSIVKVEALFEPTDSVLALINTLNTNLAKTDKAVSELNSDFNNIHIGERVDDFNNSPFGWSSGDMSTMNNPFPNFWTNVLTVSGGGASETYKQQIAISWANGYPNKIATRVQDSGTWFAWDYLATTKTYELVLNSTSEQWVSVNVENYKDICITWLTDTGVVIEVSNIPVQILNLELNSVQWATPIYHNGTLVGQWAYTSHNNIGVYVFNNHQVRVYAK